ncbi:hypothetical protein L543_2294 [Bordetella hinzii L60]|nr:hypothetical protein L543_2294 [Bordetella hinzii L60]
MGAGVAAFVARGRGAARFGGIIKTHGERYALALHVDLQHLDRHGLAYAHDVARILDEFLGQRGDVHQAILVHADVDKGAEVGHVGDHAFEQHAGVQVVEGLDAFLELGRLELGARIAAGFFQFGEDVAHRGQAEALIGEIGRRDALERLALADDLPHVGLDAGHDALDHGIGFGVDGRGVQRVFAAGDAQKAGRLFEGLVAEARHLAQGLARGEGAIFVAPADDVLGQRAVQARDTCQQGGRGGVDVHAHGVDAVLDHGVQRAGQLALVDVMLVLAHADGLGVDLDQLGQRILQAAGDGHRAAQGHVQVGEFKRGHLGGGVDRGAGFGHHDAGERKFGELAHHVGHQLFAFARGRAVADGDELDLVLGAQRGQRVDGALAVHARFEGVDGGGVHHLAGAVDDGDLAARADARIQAQHGLGAGWRGQQQILEIGGEDPDGLGFGVFAQAPEEFALEGREQLDAPGPAADLAQPARARRGIQREQVVAQLQKAGDARHAGVGRLGLEFFLQAHAQFQHALLAAAHERQHAVRGQGAQGLVEIEPVAEIGSLGFLAVDHLGVQQARGPDVFAHIGQQVGVLGKAFGQDVARAVQRGLGVVDPRFGIEILRGQRRRVAGRVGQDGVGQRLQAGFARDLGARAALGFVGGVEVFQALLGVGAGNFLLQFGGQLALLMDGVQDGQAALFELAQIGQADFKRAQGAVIQAAGGFLAVARDEGHGGAIVQQFHGRGHLAGSHRQFGGELLDDPGVIDARRGVREGGSFRHLDTSTREKEG